MKKVQGIKQEYEMDFKHYWLCSDCAELRGGIFPKNHICTVMNDICPYCKVIKTVIPYVDFNWPNRKTAHLRD